MLTTNHVPVRAKELSQTYAYSLPENLLHATDKTRLEPDLYPMRMIRRVGKDIPYDALGPLARPLIFLEHDRNLESRVNVAS